MGNKCWAQANYSDEVPTNLYKNNLKKQDTQNSEYLTNK